MLLKGDLARAVRTLKQEEGRDLHVIGSSEFAQTLIEHDLVDRYRLMIDPLVAGGGKRLFRNGGALKRLASLRARRRAPARSSRRMQPQRVPHRRGGLSTTESARGRHSLRPPVHVMFVIKAGAVRAGRGEILTDRAVLSSSPSRVNGMLLEYRVRA
jgi:RibD C-terminal domain